MGEKEESKSLDHSGERSELAVQRTILANTRTFSAWIRTGLSAILAGLTIASFISENELFYGIGIFIYIMTYMSYKKSFQELTEKEASTSISLKLLLAVTIYRLKCLCLYN